MKVVLVRHGITEWNAQRRFQGQTDVALSALGKLQARAVGRRLRGDSFAACIASDLRRARETAEAILAEMAQPPPLRLEPELREMHFGAWEGLTFDEIAERWPEETANFRRQGLWAPPDGETWAAFDARVRRSFDRHCSASANGDALLYVVHGGVIHALLRRLMRFGGGAAPIRIDPAGVTEMELDGESAWVRLLNDRCHLDELDAIETA